MKHLVLFIIAIVIACHPMYSQHLLTNGSPTYSKTLSPSEVKKDNNKKPMAEILVRSDIEGLVFNGSGVNGYETIDGGYKVYLIDGYKSLSIEHPEYIKVDITFSPLKGGNQYNGLIVKAEEKTQLQAQQQEIEKTYPVSILRDGFNSKVKIDNQIVYGNNITLSEGEHFVNAEYNDATYSHTVNVKKNNQNIDAVLGGEIIVKNANENLTVTPVNSMYPDPNHQSTSGSKLTYDGMLGEYILDGKPNSLSFGHVKKKIRVDSRTKTVYRLDEMIDYGFSLYHGTNIQPFGVNLAWCKNFGFFLSFTSDCKTKIETEYGDAEFSRTDEEGEKKTDYKATSRTLSVGPMFRLWHKLYLQVGAGWGNYLSTSKPKILTADYKYKSTLSANASLLLRIKTFVIGVGYVHQSAKDAYDPDINNQLSFTIGAAFGL